ncbi:MAG: ATP-binding protein [Smithella sp.]|jgi:predicted ATPase
MLFGGRKREIKQIIESLSDGKNIILGGRFGIGRTTLIREIAKLLADERKFIFVDFSKTPGEMSEKLMRELGLSPRFKKTGRKMGYKSMRYRIATVMLSTKNKPIIIFDNIAKLTSQKIIFLRNLIEENHFQFIAIVENFLPPENLFELKAQFMPAKSITLNNLNVFDTENLLYSYSNHNQLNWTDNYRRNLAALTNGYPLGLTQMLKKHLTK